MSTPLPERRKARKQALSSALLSLACGLGALPALADDGLNAAIGKALFKRTWVPAPSSTRANDGLGPLFNARSCAQCHHAATTGTVAVDRDGALKEDGSVVRLSNAEGRRDPIYGAQIQTRAVAQLTPEARVRITWRTSSVTLAGGTRISLRAPALFLDRMASGALDPQTRSALSVAPPLDVAAQIARVDNAALRQTARKPYRPADRDGTLMLFGRKMTDRDIETATALAFHRDLGMSTRHFPDPAGDCTPAETQCRNAPDGGDADGVEIAPAIVSALADYIRSLPEPSAPDRDNAEGRALFERIGCATCHTPSQKTRNRRDVALFSDLALHDLGTGLASLSEPGRRAGLWRTAPLIGLRQRLKAGATLLNDGRARTVPEAILWHGGEAATSAGRYAKLPAEARAALEQYLLGR